MGVHWCEDCQGAGFVIRPRRFLGWLWALAPRKCHRCAGTGKEPPPKQLQRASPPPPRKQTGNTTSASIRKAQDAYAELQRKIAEPKIETIDFSCRVCGAPCPIAPRPPERAVCEEHCPDHDYQYDPWRRAKVCVVCDAQAPDDYCEP